MCDIKDILFWIAVSIVAFYAYDALLGDMVEVSPFWRLP